jgi:hypothetical protein
VGRRNWWLWVFHHGADAVFVADLIRPAPAGSPSSLHSAAGLVSHPAPPAHLPTTDAPGRLLQSETTMSDPSEHAHHVHAAHAAVQQGNLALAKIHYAQAWRCVDVGTLIIGDSHVFTFLEAGHTLPIWLGAITMHRVARDAAAFLALSELDVYAGLDIVFCFGEIDARLHIMRQVESTGSTAKDIIGDLVERYVHSIAHIVDRPGLRCFVTTPVPPQPIKPGSPYAASEIAPLVERIAVARELAEALISQAGIHDIGVIDVYRALRTDDGCMQRDCASDEIHAYTQSGRLAAANLLLAAQGGNWTRSPIVI